MTLSRTIYLTSPSYPSTVVVCKIPFEHLHIVDFVSSSDPCAILQAAVSMIQYTTLHHFLIG